MAGISLLFVGAVLAIAGVVVWLAARRRSRVEPRGFDVGPPRPPES